MKNDNDYLILGIFLLVLALLMAFMPYAHGQIPINAYKYKRTLRREVTSIWGPDQPMTIFAAQIHAESRWNPLAQSPYASGLGQQTPNTERWLNDLDRDLANLGGGALNPRWSIRALVFYDHWLEDYWSRQRNSGNDGFNRWGMVLHSYNAGAGWLKRERSASGCPGYDYWCCIRYTCLRSKANCEQTRRYTYNIWFVYQPMYEEDGW